MHVCVLACLQVLLDNCCVRASMHINALDGLQMCGTKKV